MLQASKCVHYTRKFIIIGISICLMRATKKEAYASLFIVMPYFLIGLKTSRPPINGRKTSGITTDPSSC